MTCALPSGLGESARAMRAASFVFTALIVVSMARMPINYQTEEKNVRLLYQEE